MWRQTLVRGVLYLLSAEYSSNVRGLARNLSDLTVASSQYGILLCSENLVSDMRHVSELLVPGFGRPVLLCLGKMSQAHGMAVWHMPHGISSHHLYFPTFINNIFFCQFY